MNEMLRYTIIRVILFVMGGFLVLGCSDEDDVGNSGGTSKYGLIRMAEEDYDSSNTSYIFQDEEPDEVLFDSSKRKFKVNEPLQVSVTGQKELMLRFYSPRAIHNVIVWATVEGYEDEVRFAEFTTVLPFQEFKMKLPFLERAKVYYTRSGEEVTIDAHPDIVAENISLRVECGDPVYQGMINVKPKWDIWFGKYSGSNWGNFRPHLAREAVALSLNMAAMFSSSLFDEELEKWRGKLINNEQIVDIDVLKKQITNHGGLCYGRVVNVVGLGGGNTFGLGEYVYLTHYADDANGSDTPYHELAHCLGYGHSGNMTYYPAEGGFPTICMKVYSQLSVSKNLPVYSVLDIPGATVETFHPKAVHLYGNTLYVANDAPGHYSLEVFDVSSGNVRHVKSMVEWMNGDKKETFAGEPNGVTRSYGKIYVTNTGSRTDVFDAETYEFITCIGTGTWGEGGYQTVHAFDVTASQGAVFIRDKRKLVVVLEQDVQPGSAARVPIYSRSVNLQEAMGTYAVAARNDGFLYVTAQNKNIIYLFDPADIRAGDTGFAPYLVTLGFEKSPQSIAFVGDRLFVTLRVDDKRSELWEISPKNGKLLQDFTDSMVYPEKIAGARHTLLVVDRATQTVKAIGL